MYLLRYIYIHHLGYMYIICLWNIVSTIYSTCIFQDTEMQVVIVGAGRADLVAQTKAGFSGRLR